ncbi:MAG: 50S ribosomal protein L29 [Planctomycetaceae bacterium]|nr:50S ribosomal protein L29 [Planctomycetaceae bacterium]
MSKASELREMNEEQLEFSLKQAQKDLFDLRFKAATEKLDAPSRMKELRREIARVKTLLREKEIAAASE